MSIFNLTRKTEVVPVGDGSVTLTEPSALERMAYGEHFSSVGSDERISPSELLRIDVAARIGLIVDCMAYELRGVDKDAIRAEVENLPPQPLNALSEAAMRLAGLLAEPGQDDAEKKSQTPDQSEQ